jgi:hypothetical protein
VRAISAARLSRYCDLRHSDVWYPRLAHITPRTVFIPMRKSEAAAIKAYAPAPFCIERIYELRHQATVHIVTQTQIP